MKGIITSCLTDEERIVELKYQIKKTDNGKVFYVLNGVTGYESICVESEYVNLEGMVSKGWLACIGTKGKCNRLFVPGDEMKKVFEREHIEYMNRDFKSIPIHDMLMGESR